MTTNSTSARRAQSHPRIPSTVAQVLRRARQGNVTLADIGRTAEALEVPIWLLLLPGLHEHRELLTEGGLAGLRALVSDYLASSPEKRTEIEIIARAGATVSRGLGRAARPRATVKGRGKRAARGHNRGGGG